MNDLKITNLVKSKAHNPQIRCAPQVTMMIIGTATGFVKGDGTPNGKKNTHLTSTLFELVPKDESHIDQFASELSDLIAKYQCQPQRLANIPKTQYGDSNTGVTLDFVSGGSNMSFFNALEGIPDVKKLIDERKKDIRNSSNNNDQATDEVKA